jgi:hypothetical protein
LETPIGFRTIDGGRAKDTVAGDSSNVLVGGAAGDAVGRGDDDACRFSVSLLRANSEVASI